MLLAPVSLFGFVREGYCQLPCWGYIPGLGSFAAYPVEVGGVAYARFVWYPEGASTWEVKTYTGSTLLASTSGTGTRTVDAAWTDDQAYYTTLGISGVIKTRVWFVGTPYEGIELDSAGMADAPTSD